MIHPEMIAEWGETYDAEEGIAWLLKKLLQASSEGELNFYDIKTGKQTHCSGFDGYTDSTRRTSHIPIGKTIWEFGAEAKPKLKFKRDFKKRTLNLRKKRNNYNFAFVTPRKWQDYDVCEESLNSHGKLGWKYVKIHNSFTIANWIEEYPWVVYDFLKRVKQEELYKIRTLSQECNEILSFFYYDRTMIADFIHSGRRNPAEAIAQWLIHPDDKTLKLISQDSLVESRHFLAESLYRVFSKNDCEYFANKILFLPSKSTPFNPSHLKKDNVVVGNEDQIRLLSKLQNSTGCRIIVLIHRQTYLLPFESKIELSELDIELTENYLVRIKYPEQEIRTLLKNRSYQEIRRQTLGDEL